MKNWFLLVLIAAALVFPCASQALFIDLYASGEASLTQKGTWATDDITLSYTVYKGSFADDGSWLYMYCWDGETPGISHAIIQLTDELTLDDLVLDSSSDKFEIGTFGPGYDGQSNPNIPWTFWGVKFDDFTDQGECFSIISEHNPVEGYFYAKGGGGKVLGEAWASDILRPNGAKEPYGSPRVPDQTSTVSALGLGMLLAGRLRRLLGR